MAAVGEESPVEQRDLEDRQLQPGYQRLDRQRKITVLRDRIEDQRDDIQDVTLARVEAEPPVAGGNHADGAADVDRWPACRVQPS